MKRLIPLIFAIIFLSTLSLQPAFAAEQPKDIPVYIDDLPVKFDVPPVIQNGRTLVPFRAIAEALSINVAWEGSTRTINANDAKTTVSLQIGKQTASKNNEAVPLDAPPVIINGRTLIPLRFFSEAFGCKVAWDDAVKAVKISSPVKEMTVLGYYALGVPGKSSSWEDLFIKPYPEKTEGNTGLVSDLAFGWYSMDEQGNLLTNSPNGWKKPEGYDKVLAAAKEYNMKAEMVVHMTDSGSAINKLIGSEEAVKKAVEAIASEAKQYNGVDIDFEGLGFQDAPEQLAVVRNNFSRFIQLLSEKLKQNNQYLTLALHPQNSEYRGYDYKTLGKLADRIVVMAYDYNLKPAPEPVNRVTQAIEAARADVPAEKLVLGISANSETPESIGSKVGLAKKYGLNGIAIWRLGLVQDGMWEVMKNMVAAKK